MVNRRLCVMRHAERMDLTFGNWIATCFENGKYKQQDLNQPEDLPVRETPQEYEKDSPLTNVGLFQASLIGKSFKKEGFAFTNVYCSPSLRCVQTAVAVLNALGSSATKVNVEPGLFEWLGWYHDCRPQWMSLESLKLNGYNVNLNYKPFIAKEEMEIRIGETICGYYERSHNVTLSILNSCTGDVLIVAHAASLDVCTRKLIGKGVRNEQDFSRFIVKIAYCSVVVAENDEQEDSNEWKLVEPPITSITQSGNQRFDWKMLD
ncbi:protein UBASH3A-like protein [Leptotrombidium deliense]|uniref:Protein UBASH3A-like protein n=1 Tax=Leptotrombidium deliense TaxID=299467 RepID=A0A443SBM0_9ACAR|nr:protein UBASH3A-like protein [Leptotrombidium deliense]